jgi:ABC-2 type transport system permease protein
LSFVKIFLHEIKNIITDTAVILTIIGGVILYSFLYPQPYARQSISALNVSVVDYDKSDVSRSVIFKLEATPQIEITRNDLSEKDAKEALVRGEVKAIVVIPRAVKRDLALNKSPTIAVGADSSYFLIYGGVLEGAMKAILTQSATIKVARLLKKQVPLNQAKESYIPYSLNVINLFNKNNSYTQYVIPAVFILILQQTMLIGLGILGGGVNERMRRREKDYFTDAPIWEIYLSRAIIFFMLFFVHMLYYFGYSFTHFEVTRLANMSDLLTFGVAFLCASISFGLLLGSLFSSREIATPIVLFSSLPLVFAAGFVWPVEELPQSIYALAMLVPSTPAIHGFLSVNQMGADFSMVVDSYTILWMQCVVYLSFAVIIFSWKRKKYVSKLF